MLPPPQPPIHGTTSTTARARTRPMDAPHARGRRIPQSWRRPTRWVGSRALALGLVACVASGPIASPSAVAQQAAAAPAARAVSGQLPTPTPTPTPSAIPVQISPGDLFQTPPPIVISPVEVTGGSGTITVDPTPAPVAQEQITVSGCGSPDYIFQGCTLVPVGETQPLRRFEAQAIASVLQQYQLPESERARVLRYARNEVRAALFAQLVEAFRKAPGARTDDERVLVAAFTRLVRDKHVEAVTAAQVEYRSWAANPCNYEPPAGFTYSARSACIGTSGAFTPASPGLRAFYAYGVAAAYKAARDPGPELVFAGTSSAALVGYGFTAALGLGAGGALIGSAMPLSSFTALFPYAAKGGGSAAAGSFGGLIVGGPIAIIMIAVTTGVIAGISVFNDAAIPGQLDELLTGARSYDVGIAMGFDVGQAMLSSGADVRTFAQQELFAAFVLNTMPDYPGTDPAPAAQPGDPRFVVAGSPVDRLQYTAADGSQRVVRLSGQWFADRPASAAAGTARLTLAINYRDAAGAEWTARRVGNQFVIVRVGDPAAADYPAPRQSADLSVVDGSGRPVTARVGG